MQSGTSNKFFLSADIWTQSSFNLLFQWWIKQNILKYLWKFSRLSNKYPQWIVRTRHCRSLFKMLKSYIVVVEFYFLVRLKTLSLKYSKTWFPWNRLCREDSKQSYSTRPFKKYVSWEGGRSSWQKWQKATKGRGSSARSWCHFLQFFLCPFSFQLNFRSYVSHAVLIMLK